MPLTIFQEIHDEPRKQKIHAHFAQEIKRLKALGFKEEVYGREVAFPLSALLLLPNAFYMALKHALLGVEGFLRLTDSNITLIHEEGYAFAEPSKIYGVSFVTLFDDDTLLATVRKSRLLRPNDKYRFVCQVYTTPVLAAAWQQHMDEIAKLTEEGRSVVAPLTSSDLLWISRRFDQIVFGGSIYERGERPKSARTDSPKL